MNKIKKLNYSLRYCPSKYYIVEDVDLNEVNINGFIDWLKVEAIIALSMRNLKVFKGKNCCIVFHNILQLLIKTYVAAVNFGENDQINKFQPLTALIDHVRGGGCIRRYFIETCYISKLERRQSGLFNVLFEERQKDEKYLLRSQSKWIFFSKIEWKAIDNSKCTMGYYNVNSTEANKIKIKNSLIKF